jgi:Alginate lyase
MNPNLKYGQSVKGVTDGRAEGLIDTRQFIFLIDGVELLKTSSGFTIKQHQDLKKWFAAFLNWMETSEIGKDEMNTKNNHGVWYDAQTLSFALFTDDLVSAKKIVERATARLDTELDSNGSFPLEMKRTTSMNYTAFILNAYIIIAELSEKTGTDFWVLKTTSGKSLQSAFNFLLPYISKQKQWTGNQIKEFNYLNGFPILLRGSTKFNCNQCMDAIKDIVPDKYQKLLLQLL